MVFLQLLKKLFLLATSEHKIPLSPCILIIFFIAEIILLKEIVAALVNGFENYIQSFY